MARCNHSARRCCLPDRLDPRRTHLRPTPTLTYRALLERLDHWFDVGVRASLPVVVPCKSGCNRCCHGPFDISAADTQLVAEAVGALPIPVRLSIEQRAKQQLAAGSRVVSEWGAPWRVGEISDSAFDKMCDALENDPCPALDPTSGACLIHPDRPATCRLMGLALRTPQGDQLENLCPIQDRFPGYGELPATLFDLMDFEVDAAHADVAAMDAGWHPTTVAGAIARSSAASPGFPEEAAR